MVRISAERCVRGLEVGIRRLTEAGIGDRNVRGD